MTRTALALLALLLGCSPAKSPPPDPRLSADELDVARWQATFRRYLRIDTTNPPGNEARAFPLLEAELRRLGLEPRRRLLAPERPTEGSETATAARGNVWAVLEAPSPKGRPIVLLHHIDVVPVERSSWSVDPFAADVVDGRVYARGAIDTKILGVYALATLERLAQAKDRLTRDVVFLAVADEESGGAGARAAVEHDLAAWDPEYLVDEGGFAIRDFMNGRDILVVATAQKRGTRMKITALGEAGHGSRPIPNGGPTLLARALYRLVENPAPMRLGPTTRQTFTAFSEIAGGVQGFLLARLHWPGVLSLLEGTLSANENLNPMLRDTASPTLLRAGQKINVIPAEATAELDVRLLPDTDPEAFLARVRALLADLPVKVELTETPDAPYPPSPTDDPLYRALEAATRAHHPEAVVAPWLMVGVNDSRFFAAEGVRTYGFNPAFLSKAQIDGIHGHDESVDVAAFAEGLSTYAEAIERFVLAPDGETK